MNDGKECCNSSQQTKEECTENPCCKDDPKVECTNPSNETVTPSSINEQIAQKIDCSSNRGCSG